MKQTIYGAVLAAVIGASLVVAFLIAFGKDEIVNKPPICKPGYVGTLLRFEDRPACIPGYVPER
jgi:hypothetical protein